MLPTAWWCRNNLLFTYYMGSSLHEQLHSNLKLAQLWTQRWMFHSEVDVGNKLSTQTPSSAHWMGTRSHLRMTFTCVVAIYISDASSYNCCYNDHGIYLRLMNRQNYFLVFWARTGSTPLSYLWLYGSYISMFSWDFEVVSWLRFWRWNLSKLCVRTHNMTSRTYFGKMNSILGFVVPLAMF